MADYSKFNDGTRPNPAAPIQIAVRNVILDLASGRIDTNLRFGRKNQWKTEQRDRYVSRLLEGKFHPDPISISRKIVSGRTSDRAINGNNRLRAVRAFVENTFGVTNMGIDGKVHTYYYSEIPESEIARPSRRSFVHVLPDAVRNAFDDRHLLFNVRENLSESEEIAWYKELNVNIAPHTTGQILIADMCDVENGIINAMLSTFPIMKRHVGEVETPNDAFSVGTYLLEVSDATFDPLDERDKDETLMASLANLFNILMNGHCYNKGFSGSLDLPALTSNVRQVRHIFENVRLNDELKEKLREETPRKKYLPLFWNPSYLLGPLFWSIATRQDRAADTWIHFLNSADATTIGTVYYDNRDTTNSTNMNRMRELYNKVRDYVTTSTA